MRLHRNQKALAILGTAFAAAVLAGPAEAAGFNDMASYTHPYGMGAGQETQAITPSLRDSNGNLTVVNGQITSSNVSQKSGVQTAGTTVTGSGSGGSGAMFGGATAIGNSLNVVTNGSNNTVIVTSTQTNNGDQTANVSVVGK